MHRVDAVVQVFAETAFPHQLLQVHIRGADQADIHRNGLGTAHTHHASVLDHPQQLGLQVQRNIADFVQEQRPAVGLLKLAYMARMGIGEGAFYVAEEFALEQRFGNGPGIHRHHRLSAAEAPGMDLPRQHILAGAVFAGDEHRGVGRGNLVHRFPDGGHRPGSAPEHGSFPLPGMTGCLAWSGARRISPHRFPGFVARCRQRGHQLVIVPRLHDEVEGPAFHPFHSQLDIRIGRKQHYLHLRSHLLDFSGPVETFIAGVDAGVEVHVQQHHIRPELLQG